MPNFLVIFLQAIFSPESPESQSVASLGSLRGSLSSSKCSASLQRARQERSARRDTGILRHVILKGISAQLNSAAVSLHYVGLPLKHMLIEALQLFTNIKCWMSETSDLLGSL